MNIVNELKLIKSTLWSRIMINNPHSKDHYKYLNELLNLENENRLAAKKAINNQQEVIKQLNTKIQEIQNKKENITELEQANLEKMKRALEILEDEEKRKRYDTALTSHPSMDLKTEDKKGISFVPLVDIKEIINEFVDFKKEQMDKKDEKGHPLFPEGSFKYEKLDGPPTVHVFTFPDEASANEFMQRLFNKNMAMLPNGSQDIEDVKKMRNQQNQQEIKEKMGAFKEEKMNSQQKEEKEVDERSSLVSQL